MRKILELSNGNLLAVENAEVRFEGTMSDVTIVAEHEADKMTNSEWQEANTNPERFKVVKKGNTHKIEKRSLKK